MLQGVDVLLRHRAPPSTPEVISVAQTQVPSAKLYRIVAGSVAAAGSWQPWSAAPALVSGRLQYGNGGGGNLIGCAAFAPGSLTGKVLLVDRGTSAISVKVSNGAAGGALVDHEVVPRTVAFSMCAQETFPEDSRDSLLTTYLVVAKLSP